MAKGMIAHTFDVLADGRVMVRRTTGDLPLPNDGATPSTETIEFASKQDFMNAIKEAEERVAADLMFVQAGAALKGDPNLGATFKSAFVGKLSQVDLSGTATTIKIS